MISIIVPVYKVEKYLARCIDSIINQTYRDLEIILVDDGSPDGCGKICDEYALKDNRIKVIHKENGGLSDARNAGLNIAKGEYIGFVDSDDTIEPTMFEVLVNFITSTNCDLAICKAKIITEKGLIISNELDSSIIILNSDQLWNEVVGELNNSAWNKLYRHNLIGNLRFPKGICHGEDLLFNIPYISSCKSAVVINQSLYNYLKRDDSITTSIFSEKNFDEVTIKDKANELVNALYPKLNNKSLLYCCYARMNLCRKLYKNKKQDYYHETLNEYKNFLKQNYNNIKTIMKLYRKIELFLLLYCSFCYRLIFR